jgi:hypothetical protein
MAGIPGSRNIKDMGNAAYRKLMRQEAIDFLGGVCDMCGTSEDLQFDHIDLKSGEADRKIRRETGGSRRYNHNKIQCKSHLLKECNKDVRLLCKCCHKKWSTAQRAAAFKLLASLSIDQQIKLTNDELL